MRISHNTKADHINGVMRNINYNLFRITVIALTFLSPIGVRQFESVSFGDEQNTGHVHRPVAMGQSNTAANEGNSLDGQNSHRRELRNSQQRLLSNHPEYQQVQHTQTELSPQSQLARKQQQQAFNNAQAGTIQQVQALEYASPAGGYAPPQQYYVPKPQSQPIFRGQEINNPLPKTATERAWELAAENIRLRDELSDRNRELQALRSELQHARQAIISANHIVETTVGKIDEVSQTLAERNAQIQRMHQLIREHELNTAARLKRLTLSIQRSLEEETVIPKTITHSAPAEPPTKSAPFTIEPDDVSASSSTAAKPVELTPMLNRPNPNAVSRLPAVSGTETP